MTREGCWCSQLAHGEEIRRTNSTGSSETCSHGELWEKITDPSGLYFLAHSPECLHYPRATVGNHPHITRRICSVVKLYPCNQCSATTASNTWTRGGERLSWRIEARHYVILQISSTLVHTNTLDYLLYMYSVTSQWKCLADSTLTFKKFHERELSGTKRVRQIPLKSF